MKKNKLKISELKVKNFIITISNSGATQIKGGVNSNEETNLNEEAEAEEGEEY